MKLWSILAIICNYCIYAKYTKHCSWFQSSTTPPYPSGIFSPVSATKPSTTKQDFHSNKLHLCYVVISRELPLPSDICQRCTQRYCGGSWIFLANINPMERGIKHNKADFLQSKKHRRAHINLSFFPRDHGVSLLFATPPELVDTWILNSGEDRHRQVAKYRLNPT